MNGLLALIGIASAHLAANLFDDYFDYNILCKDESYINSAQKCKCSHIRDGIVKHVDILKAAGVFSGIAFIIGLILMVITGWQVIAFALAGALIVLFYSKMSLVGLSEVGVGIAFGPLLFEGVYFAMTRTFSTEVFLLSLIVVTFTTGLLYAHTLLDFDGDVTLHKKTLCCRFGTKDKALKFLGWLYIVGYLQVIYFVYFTHNFYFLITFLILPYIFELYDSLRLYNLDKTIVPKRHWWNFPMENWANIQMEGTASFYFRIYQSRNIMVYFSILACLAIIL